MRCKQTRMKTEKKNYFYNSSFLIRISNFSPNYTLNNYDNLIDVNASRVSKYFIKYLFTLFIDQKAKSVCVRKFLFPPFEAVCETFSFDDAIDTTCYVAK